MLTAMFQNVAKPTTDALENAPKPLIYLQLFYQLSPHAIFVISRKWASAGVSMD